MKVTKNLQNEVINIAANVYHIDRKLAKKYTKKMFKERLHWLDIPQISLDPGYYANIMIHEYGIKQSQNKET